MGKLQDRYEKIHRKEQKRYYEVNNNIVKYYFIIGYGDEFHTSVQVLEPEYSFNVKYGKLSNKNFNDLDEVIFIAKKIAEKYNLEYKVFESFYCEFNESEIERILKVEELAKNNNIKYDIIDNQTEVDIYKFIEEYNNK